MCRLLVITVVVLASTRVQAEIRPSFNMERCAWNATDIVVASEGKAIDGELTVQRVLAGDLNKGDSISVEELGQYWDEERRTVRPFPFLHNSDDTEPPLVLAGYKLLLFLKREGTATKPKWSPASAYGGMKVSVVWVDEGRTYSFVQVINPGPSVLAPLNFPEARLVQRVSDIVRTRRDMSAVSKLVDRKRRARMALGFVDSDIIRARDEAFRILSASGDDALPHLRTLLRDPNKVRLHGEAIRTLGVVGGKAVVPELTSMVEKELSFWKRTAPELEVGWWNGKGLEAKQLERLRNRYSRVLMVFYQLRKLKSPACATAVRDFRDYWRSLPQLEDKSGLDQMSQVCDAILREIPRQHDDGEHRTSNKAE